MLKKLIFQSLLWCYSGSNGKKRKYQIGKK